MADAVAARFWREENTVDPWQRENRAQVCAVSPSQAVIENLSSLVNVTSQAFSVIAFLRVLANLMTEAEWVSI
jgi:hypothetical protein